MWTQIGRRVFVPASGRELVDKMFDKVAAAELFERLGLPIPATYRDGDPCLRLIAKPRFGSASKGIVEINSLQKLYELQGVSHRYLIQERIDNREELTVDCYVCVRTGHIAGISPRVRLEVSGGEVSMGETVEAIMRLMGSDAELVLDPARLRPAKSEVNRLCGDNTLITTLTSWRPSHTLDDGLRKTIEWFTRPGVLSKYKPDIYNR